MSRTTQTTCPTCGMSASPNDHRHFTPVKRSEGTDERRCRNCGATLELANAEATPADLVH